MFCILIYVSVLYTVFDIRKQVKKYNVKLKKLNGKLISQSNEIKLFNCDYY